MARTLRLILGDQLNIHHSWFTKKEADITYVMMEIRQETDYVTHHIQKVVAFFAAMRSFAEELGAQGHSVVYIRLDDAENTQSLSGNLLRLIDAGSYQRFEYQLPDEYRLDEQLRQMCDGLPVASRAFDTEHFITSRKELSRFFIDKKYGSSLK